MNIKRNCIFLLDKEKDKTDAKLRYRIKWGDNIVAFNVGYRVDIDKWSPDSQRCKNNTTHGTKKVHSSIINKAIQNYEDICDNLDHCLYMTFAVYYFDAFIQDQSAFRVGLVI